MSNAQPATQAALDMLKRTDIKQSAVELRLNMDGWPAGVDPKAYFITDLHRAAVDAGNAFTGFTATQTRNRLNENLTPAGVFAADVEWAEKFLGPIRDRLTKLREDRDKTREQVLTSLTKQQTVHPEDAHTIAMHREIRETLGKMPQAARKLKVQEWTMGGDEEALRAVLTVPAYLTGLEPADLGELRELVARRQNPEKFAAYEAYQQAATFAERALDGVVRFVDQETRADARAQNALRLAREQDQRRRFEASAGSTLPPEPFGGGASHQPSQAG